MFLYVSTPYTIESQERKKIEGSQENLKNVINLNPCTISLDDI